MFKLKTEPMRMKEPCITTFKHDDIATARYTWSPSPTMDSCHMIYFLILVDICPFLRLLIPLFWTSGDIFSGFQSQSGFCLICTLAWVYVI